MFPIQKVLSIYKFFPKKSKEEMLNYKFLIPN